MVRCGRSLPTSAEQLIHVTQLHSPSKGMLNAYVVNTMRTLLIGSWVESVCQGKPCTVTQMAQHDASVISDLSVARTHAPEMRIRGPTCALKSPINQVLVRRGRSVQEQLQLSEKLSVDFTCRFLWRVGSNERVVNRMLNYYTADPARPTFSRIKMLNNVAQDEPVDMKKQQRPCMRILSSFALPHEMQ